MHLYFKPGACSMAAHIILNEARAEYTLEQVDTEAGLTASGASYAGINPRGYVPALRLADGEVITENAAVLQFLGDTFADLGLAPAAGTRARVRLHEVLSFLSSELHVAFSPFFARPDMSADKRAAATARLVAKLGQMAALLSDGRPYLLGDGFTVADAYGFVILNWSNFIGVSLEAWPDLTAFLARVGARASVQDTLQQEGLAA